MYPSFYLKIFFRYHTQRNAEEAVSAMDGANLLGRDLRVIIANHPRPDPAPRYSGVGDYNNRNPYSSNSSFNNSYRSR